MIAFSSNTCAGVSFQSFFNSKNASFCWLFLIFFLVSLRSLDVIDRCFSRRTMEEIISALVIFSFIYIVKVGLHSFLS